jgi:DNA-binding LacI/PurR family transcriptional regulator
VGRRVGIKDVAEAAGVSITTVSHALSGKGRLPERTRRRVREVAESLGYVPHPAARSLASGRTGLVAMVVSVHGNAPIAFTEIDYYVELMNGATRAAMERGLALVLAPSTAGAETWGLLPLDGVIVIDPADGDPTIATLRARGTPIVFVGRDPNGDPSDLVVQNDRSGGTVAVLDHLAAGGTRRVGVFAPRTFESFTDDALQAYRGWCAARDQPPLVWTTPVEPTAGEEELREAASAFLAAEERPDAVFCPYERVAVELVASARAAGVEVPAELAVATVSELGLAERNDPPITTLEISQAVLGARAASLLADVLDGRPGASVLDVPTLLVPRASSAGP